MASTLSGASTEKHSSRSKFYITRKYEATSLLCLIAWIFLIVSFAAPYWLSSFTKAYASFVRLGLWDVCFNNYRHPPYQYDEKFDGCNWIYSAKYQNIREWLQPGWFIMVQAMLTLALIFTTLALILISASLMYYLVRYHIVVTAVAAGLEAISAICMLIGISIFASYAFERSWLQYPNFNHLDWAYFLAVITMILLFIASGLLIKESWREYQRKRKMTNLVYSMRPRNGGSIEARPMMPIEELSVDRPSAYQPHFTQV
ncbi:uncharacterized protein LOC128394988 [Panonychus citri]|uniref:uncharacterized protein LOC128394988 n=1 Tax=Panonychus citri TaxID=50023 RepID=UPI0023075254|nr:uncharacterized protein LOC128394988 [Panonychus citri]